VLSEAVTGVPVTGIDPDALDTILVNDRLRDDVDAALGQLMLFSRDRDAGLAAARDAFRYPSATNAARLDKAIAGETDPQVRAAMLRALDAARLFSGTKTERLAAVQAFAGSTDPQVQSLLDRVRADPQTGPEIRKATEAALASSSSESSPICSRASVSAACCCWPRSGSPSRSV
jgi:urea transport system permease protein